MTELMILAALATLTAVAVKMAPQMKRVSVRIKRQDRR